ncbi:unnamed protein product [Ambrosiozyma monospora]|uniref:Unnamed protein product n=1 Tax=Ambrosiozyma monospora TaxID=43982 RepID=A0A9W6YWL8_AMBMO|nr:unnamed protein product [Ambrosiozyma monospora]
MAVEIKVRIPIDVDLEDKVIQLKEIVEVKEGIPPIQQKFLFAGRQLDDDKTLGSYGIVAGSDLHLVLALRGGN